MKKICLSILFIFSLCILVSLGFAQDNGWQKDYISALTKGKTAVDKKASGLGYTPSEATVLEQAIKAAMEKKAPPCEAMKIAVDLKYSPYAVIKNVFAHGGEVNLNQLCMCATESGISKQIIARAAADAASPLGTPVYSRDEIAQAQCLQDIGLGYAARDQRLPPPIEPPDPPPSVSASSPSS